MKKLINYIKIAALIMLLIGYATYEFIKYSVKRIFKKRKKEEGN